LRVHDERVDVDIGIGPERAGDHRALRVHHGLLGCQLAAADQLADQRVVVGQLLQLAAADAVRAGVADVTDRHASGPVVDERDGHGRAHSGGGGILGRALVDASVRLLDELGHVGLLVAGHVRAQLERFDGQARGDLAGLRAAHAVRDREQRRLVDVRVLVVATLAARMGEVCRAEGHCSNLRSVSPTRITSPGLNRRGRVT
jgi:hypothetical protein